MTITGLKRPATPLPVDPRPSKRTKQEAGSPPFGAPADEVRFGSKHPKAKRTDGSSVGSTVPKPKEQKLESEDSQEKQSTEDTPPPKSKWSIERIADRIIDFINWVQAKLDEMSQKFSQFLDTMSAKLTKKEDSSTEDKPTVDGQKDGQKKKQQSAK